MVFFYKMERPDKILSIKDVELTVTNCFPRRIQFQKACLWNWPKGQRRVGIDVKTWIIANWPQFNRVSPKGFQRSLQGSSQNRISANPRTIGFLICITFLCFQLEVVINLQPTEKAQDERLEGYHFYMAVNRYGLLVIFCSSLPSLLLLHLSMVYHT